MELENNKNSLSEGYLLHWYQIKNVLGRGGFGITYLAQDNNLVLSSNKCYSSQLT